MVKECPPSLILLDRHATLDQMGTNSRYISARTTLQIGAHYPVARCPGLYILAYESILLNNRLTSSSTRVPALQAIAPEFRSADIFAYLIFRLTYRFTA